MDTKDRSISGVLLKREGHRATLAMARWSRKYVTFTVTKGSGKSGKSQAVLRYFNVTSAEAAAGQKPRKELSMDSSFLCIDAPNMKFEVRTPRGYTIIFKCSSSEELEQWVSRVEPPNYRDRLVAFYNERNPKKVSEVDLMLERHKGRESQLLEVLVKKYGETDVERRASRKATDELAAEQARLAEEARRAEEAANRAAEMEEAPYFEAVQVESADPDNASESSNTMGPPRVVNLDEVKSDEPNRGNGSAEKPARTQSAAPDAKGQAELLASLKPVLILSILGSRDLPHTKENLLHVELHIGRTAYLASSRAVWRTPAQKAKTPPASMKLWSGRNMNPTWNAHAVMPGHAHNWANQTLVLKLVAGKAIVAECAIKFTDTVGPIPPRHHVLLPTAAALRKAAEMKSSTFSFQEESIHQPNDVFDTPKGRLFQEAPENALGSPGAERLGALLVAINVVEPSVAMDESGHEKLIQEMQARLERIHQESEALASTIDLHPDSLAEANRAGLKNTEYFEEQFAQYQKWMKAATAEQKALRKNIKSLEAKLEQSLEKNREQAKTIGLLHSGASLENVQKSGYYLVPMKSSPDPDRSEVPSTSPIFDEPEIDDTRPPEESTQDNVDAPSTAYSNVASPPQNSFATSPAMTPQGNLEEGVLASQPPPPPIVTTVVTTLPVPPSQLEQPRHMTTTKSQEKRRGSETKRRKDREALRGETLEKQPRQSPKKVVLPFEVEEEARKELVKTKLEEEKQKRVAEAATKLEKEREQRVEAVKRRMAKKAAIAKQEDAETSIHAHHMAKLKTGLRQIKSEDPAKWA